MTAELFECHGHCMMDGADFSAARKRHREGVDEAALRAALEDMQRAGIRYFRDGGDACGVSVRARELAGEYGLTIATPIFAIHKNGRYGGIVGRGWDSLDDARALIAEAKEQGADFIKFMFSGIITFKACGELSCPSLERGEINALIRAAHGAGLSVMAHTNGAEAVLAAAECGVDSVEHGYFLDERCLSAMAEHGTLWVPTLAATAAFVEREGFDRAVTERTLRTQQHMVARGVEMGVKIACGSDAGAVGVPHGEGAKTELTLLNEAVGGELNARWAEACREVERRFRRETAFPGL